MRTYPERAEAERLVREAECCNPGPWGDHCRVAARCAEKIAAAAKLSKKGNVGVDAHIDPLQNVTNLPKTAKNR